MPAPVLTKNPTEVKTGPGTIYVGPANTTEPTWAATASKFTNSMAGFYSWGYTEAGITVTFGAPDTATITPAEEYDPIKIVTTGRAPTTISFNIFGVNEVYTKYAFNGGTWATVGAGAAATLVRRYTPPTPGTETRCSILFLSSDADEVLYFAQMLQTGEVSRTFTKGDTTAGYTGLSFSTEIPPTGAVWNYLTAGAGFTGPTVTS